MKYLSALMCGLMLSACGGGGGGGGGTGGGQSGSGALSSAVYSGTGIGLWRYDNTTGAAATVQVNIAGVTVGKTATLVFSNGSGAGAALPSPGALASADLSASVLADAARLADAAPAHPEDDAHAQMLARNRQTATGLIRTRPAARPAADLTSAQAAPTLSRVSRIGTSRTWNDNFLATSVPYRASVQAECLLPSGRTVVWWVDPNIVASGTFTALAWADTLAKLQSAYCGSTGGLARLNSLLGDVWGAAAADYADLITDGAALQDVNIVLLNVPSTSKWAGYFYGEDTKNKAAYANSNEALAVFINASQIKTDFKFAASTLLHESTHMVNYFQRSVARSVVHDSWLEETTAMMTEDIVAPALLGGYNKVLSYRLATYVGSGGNVSYINWPTLADASAHYALGGGFGAFLNRRYRLAIYQKLVDVCADTPALSSYACLDGLIKASGGAGFSDEFARFGATVFGRFPASGAPEGYGYPATQAGVYQLQASDLSRLTLARPAALASGYRATSHTFQRDTVAAGKTAYVRSNVVVPANTSLMVIVQ